MMFDGVAARDASLRIALEASAKLMQDRPCILEAKPTSSSGHILAFTVEALRRPPAIVKSYRKWSKAPQRLTVG